MPAEFVVEDGSGKTNANSYVSVADADQYHLNRANSEWAALSETLRQSYLVRATDYVDQRFGERWVGLRGSDTQALDWPRSCVVGVEPDAIPVKLMYAVCEYAFRCKDGALAPDPKLDEAGVAMVTIGMKAGPIEKRFQSAAGSSAPATVHLIRPYPAADMYLSRLVVSGSNRVIR